MTTRTRSFVSQGFSVYMEPPLSSFLQVACIMIVMSIHLIPLLFSWARTVTLIAHLVPGTDLN